MVRRGYVNTFPAVKMVQCRKTGIILNHTIKQHFHSKLLSPFSSMNNREIYRSHSSDKQLRARTNTSHIVVDKIPLRAFINFLSRACCEKSLWDNETSIEFLWLKRKLMRKGLKNLLQSIANWCFSSPERMSVINLHRQSLDLIHNLRFSLWLIFYDILFINLPA